MKGIIYQYTSPRGKTYVGQTTDENRRRSQFFDITKPYAGKKMEAERKKYPKLNDWKYRVLTTLEEDDPDIFREKLTFLEAYHIIMTESIVDGLNTYLADAENICKNRYLKEHYLKQDPYYRNLILNNIEPDQFYYGEEEHYSITSYVNDPFWIKEINNRCMIIFNMFVNCEKKEMYEKYEKYRKSSFKVYSWPKKQLKKSVYTH